MPDDHPNALGTIGFMVKDYANFGFDQADVVVAVGYDIVEYAPARWNPLGDKRIIHVHRTVAEVDANYPLEVGLQGSIGEALDAIADAADHAPARRVRGAAGQDLLRAEWDEGAADASFPLAPARIVHDIRAVMDRDDIVLCDTGAAKMWMARLYPTYEPNTCLISNGLATMAFALPGAIAAKLVHPERRVLAVMGDGAFLMSVAELETAVRERVAARRPRLGRRRLRPDRLEAGPPLRPSRRRWPSATRTSSTLAESFGADGHRIEAADELLPTLAARPSARDGVSVIACPVDYAENALLVERLGELEGSL